VNGLSPQVEHSQRKQAGFSPGDIPEPWKIWGNHGYLLLSFKKTPGGLIFLTDKHQIKR
jgi:hypothetical protein